MFRVIYQNVAVFLAPLFLITTIAFIIMSVYRGEVILGLQAELLKQKNQDVKVVIEQIKEVNAVGEEAAAEQRVQEIIKHERTIEIEKIVKVPVYSNECISDAGLQFYNKTYVPSDASTPTVESDAGMQRSSEAS